MRVAIIPARGGSKRIPGKNIKAFAGKPIIAYSIEAARRSEVFDRIIVSTDSEEIAAVAHEYGAETPFVRPANLADDFTSTADVILHALGWLDEHGVSADQVCCLYATVPFVQSASLRSGFDILLQSGSASVYTVARYPAAIQRALKINTDGRLSMFWPEYELARTQDLPEAYLDAGQFYWLDARRFSAEKKVYGDDARPLVLPRYLAHDIDTPEDWLMAEAIYAALGALGKINQPFK